MCIETDNHMKRKQKTKRKVKPGPKKEVLKLEGDWKANIAKSFRNAKSTKG
jgi:hypothetical protein